MLLRLAIVAASTTEQVRLPSPVAVPALVVIITTMNSKHIIKQLEASGWVLRGVKGSHHIFTHLQKLGHISVPHPKELGVGLTHKLLKQAGLK